MGRISDKVSVGAPAWAAASAALASLVASQLDTDELALQVGILFRLDSSPRASARAAAFGLSAGFLATGQSRHLSSSTAWS